MNKYLKITLLFLILSFTLQAQTSSLKGKILTSDGKPAEYVSVSLIGTNKVTTSDADGGFQLKQITSGNYTLKLSFVGLQTLQKEIFLTKGTETNVGDIILSETAVKLNEVVINSQRTNQFAQKTTEYVSRIPLKYMDNSQSYSLVTAALMKEQLSTDIISSLKSITGGGTVQSNDGNATIYIRGFRADASVRNGMLAYTRVPVDPQNTEHIEIIKGPSATLFGGTTSNVVSSGGLINRVTKRPQENKSIEISYLTGSYALNRITLDYNTPLNTSKTVLFRLNSTFHTENSFQDQGYQKNFMVAPALTVKLNEKLNLMLEAEYYQTKRNLFFARGINPAKISAKSFDKLNLDYNSSYTGNDMAADMSSINYSAVLNYRISENWRSKTSFISTKNNTDGQYFRLEMVNDSMAARNFIGFIPRNTGSTQIEQDFNASHQWHWGSNEFLGGISYSQIYDDYQRYGSGFINYDTINVNTSSVPSVSMNTLENKFQSLTSIQTETSQSVTGIYVADVFKILNGLVLSAGIRYDMFQLNNTVKNGVSSKDAYSQNSWSPKFGIIYNYKNKISAFANYQNGFTNVAPSTGTSGEVTNFKPIQSDQKEAGLKFDLLGGKLASTMSYYHIGLSNILRQNPDNTTETLQDGEQKSEGFEFDIIANPFMGFNVVAGYTLNKSEYTKVTNTVIIGNRPAYTPEQMANLWASYRVLNGTLNGFGAGLGMNYVSKIYINDTNTFYSPEYAVFDGTVFYDQQKYRFSLKVDNLLDKKIWNAYGIPQKQRSFIAGFTVRI